MATPTYFNKAVQGVMDVLKGHDPAAVQAVLGREVIGIAWDEQAMESDEAAANLDLIVRVVARLYTKLTLISLNERANGVAKGLRTLGRQINPQIGFARSAKSVTRCIVVGATKLPRDINPKSVIYVGSDNWVALLSTSTPVGSGDSENPFGAGVAACLGVANIFRLSFAEQLGGAHQDSEIAFSVLDMASVKTTQTHRALEAFDIGEVHLVGAGAVANGFLWAFSRLPCIGRLHTVDPELVDGTNLQRYVLTVFGDINKAKADLAGQWLSSTKLEVRSHRTTWEKYVADRNDWRIENVVAAVDSAETRINIQAALPCRIFNSWTQAGEIGLSRHEFRSDEACLACLYMPGGQALNLDQIVNRALRLPETQEQIAEVRRRLFLSEPTDLAFLERVAAASSMPIEKIAAFEGRPLRDFYTEAVCGGAVLEFASEGMTGRAEVPMAFQSALCGVLLAADVVAHATKLRERLPTITQINLLSSFPQILSRKRAKDVDSRCICVDPDFLEAYRAKYSEVNADRRRPLASVPRRRRAATRS